VPFVPEGEIEPPSGHMKYPGTISLSEDVYRSLLTDICRSFRTHGFEHIVLIGDSGGNQAGMKAVAEKLALKWSGASTRIHFVPEYYNFTSVAEWLTDQGIRQTPEGLHDDFAMTAMMMAVDPDSVRAQQRIKADRFRINGVDLAPIDSTVEWGRRIITFRADATVKALRTQIGSRSKSS